VATTDISDFYSRIYHHRLENALRAATTKTSHVKAIMHLLSGWNGTESFGIPVGCAPSRILAEIVLADVDESLLANSVDFVRFNDDYRIFAYSARSRTPIPNEVEHPFRTKSNTHSERSRTPIPI